MSLQFLPNVVGVVQSVSPTVSIRRKINNDIIRKREIAIVDQSKKTVVVSLWNELATTFAQELLDMADKSPVVAIKSLKVGDFQGVSLSAISRSILKINPDIPESNKLRSWLGGGASSTAIRCHSSSISCRMNNSGNTQNFLHNVAPLVLVVFLCCTEPKPTPQRYLASADGDLTISIPPPFPPAEPLLHFSSFALVG